MKKLKLNIQLFASGTITFPASGYLQGKIEWSTVPDIENNRVTVVTKLYAHRTNSATTTGQSWSGSVKVGDNVKHTFNQLSSVTSVSSSWVLFKTYNDIVNYDGESIKQVTISGNVKGPSGTALANNNSSGSALVTLDELHSKPIVTIDSITELNSSLTGVANDTFVQFLSQKRFVLSATPFDDATITGYSVKNGSTIVNNTTGTLDLNINELYVEANVVPIVASASDSMNAVGSVQQNYANYILYQKPTIEPTSTTTKRNGQTSGRVLLNVAGNYWVGQIGSITNTPVVKYRYWKRGTTEPSTWITMPNASVSLDNGRITVTNYEIGSANPDDPNYFDFQFAYDIRVQIEDNFFTTNTLKGITVGEAVWSEYRDRVDFKKITLKGVEIQTPPTILYDNSSGNKGSITLSESITNYSIIEVFYGTLNAIERGGSKRFLSSCISFSLSDFNNYEIPAGGQAKSHMYQSYYGVQNAITFAPGRCLHQTVTSQGVCDVISYSADGSTNQFYITKVLGYK